MSDYTVVSLIHPGSGELLVAGVFPGHLHAADDASISGDGYERVADHVTADTAEAAEDAAIKMRGA